MPPSRTLQIANPVDNRATHLGFKVFTSRMSFTARSRAQFWALAARSSQYNVRALAQFSSMTTRQIERYCARELGRSPQDWLNEQRMIAARVLLIETESIKRAAMELGFKQVSHFCKHFKQYYGMTPSEFLLRRLRLNQPCRY